MFNHEPSLCRLMICNLCNPQPPDALKSERDELKAKLEIAVEALDKIEDHWHVTEHCELAREALTKIRGE